MFSNGDSRGRQRYVFGFYHLYVRPLILRGLKYTLTSQFIR